MTKIVDWRAWPDKKIAHAYSQVKINICKPTQILYPEPRILGEMSDELLRRRLSK